MHALNYFFVVHLIFPLARQSLTSFNTSGVIFTYCLHCNPFNLFKDAVFDII